MPAVEATTITPPLAALDHRRQERASEHDDGLAVDPHHLRVAPFGHLPEAVVGAEPGVVHQQVDLDAELGHSRGQGGGIGAQVAGDHPCLGGKLGGQRIEPIGAPGDEHEVVPAGGELARELLADP